MSGLSRGSLSFLENDGVQRYLKTRGWGAKKQKYERCRTKYGNNEGEDDVIPIVTDSTGTLYSESATWLKKNLSEKMWKRFSWEASEIFTIYYGRRLRVVSQRWSPQFKPGSAAQHRGAPWSPPSSGTDEAIGPRASRQTVRRSR